MLFINGKTSSGAALLKLLISGYFSNIKGVVRFTRLSVHWADRITATVTGMDCRKPAPFPVRACEPKNNRSQTGNVVFSHAGLKNAKISRMPDCKRATPGSKYSSDVKNHIY